MINHTKGEWKAVKSDREDVLGNSLYYVEANDDVVAHEIETLANAQLIASAPGLYEALKELIRRDEYGSIRLPTQASDIMRKALAKAEMK